MEVNLNLAIIIVGLLFLVFPTLAMIVFLKNKKVLKIIGIIFFIIYLLGLMVLVFSKVTIYNNIVRVFFEFDNKWFNIYFLWFDFGKINVILNLIMMFPVSAFLFSQNSKNIFIKTMIVSFIISVSIEFLQFALPIGRCTEIFDVVLNVLSGLIGYLYFKIVNLISNKIRVK